VTKSKAVPKISKKRVLFTCFFLFSSLCAVTQTAEIILSNYFSEVSGGDIKNWNQVKSMYLEETSFYKDPNYNNQNPFNVAPQEVKSYFNKVYWVSPENHLREVFQDSILVSKWLTTKAGRFYTFRDNPPVSIEKPPSFQFEPVKLYHLINGAKSVKLTGTKEFDDDLCYEIKVNESKKTWYLYINVNSHLLAYWSQSETGDFSTITKCYNYKRIGKFMINQSEQKSRNGFVFFTSVITKMELNPIIDIEKFKL